MKELATIQAKLNAPKGQYNSFAKYKYRSCEDILSALKPLLAENKCTLVISDDICAVGERVYVKSTVTLANGGGETAKATAFAREEESKRGMDASQVTGAASSYARKYALCGLFAIDDGRDADSLNNNKEYTQAPARANNNTPSATEQDLSDALNGYALPAIRQATSREELLRIWNDFTGLHTVTAFTAALSERRKQLGITSKHAQK